MLRELGEILNGSYPRVFMASWWRAATGEALSLSEDERRLVVETACKVNAGRGSILVGCVAESTDQAIAHAVFAQKCGADGIMASTSIYNKCNDLKTTMAHFKQVCGSVDLPVVPYNNEYANGVDLKPEYVLELVDKIPNATYVKETSQHSIQHTRDLLAWSKKPIKFLIGWDQLSLESMFVGATGWMSAGANIVPELCIKMYDLAMSKKWEEAKEVYAKLWPWFELIYCKGPNTQILKYSLDLLGLAGGPNRMPRVELDEEQKAEVRNHLKTLGAI